MCCFSSHKNLSVACYLCCMYYLLMKFEVDLSTKVGFWRIS